MFQFENDVKSNGTQTVFQKINKLLEKMTPEQLHRVYKFILYIYIYG